MQSCHENSEIFAINLFSFYFKMFSQNFHIEILINNYLLSVSFSIKMEVGIEDCLHIEFEYNKSKYALFIYASVTSGVKRNHVSLLMSYNTKYKKIVQKI